MIGGPLMIFGSCRASGLLAAMPRLVQAPLLAGKGSFLPTLILLFAGHALCDFPLQRDFLTRGKNHKAPLPGVPWYQCLFAHALIHAGMVLLITRSTWMALAELAIHALTDYAKGEGWFGSPSRSASTGENAGVDASRISPSLRRILGIVPSNLPFNIDQAIHYACKVVWAVLA